MSTDQVDDCRHHGTGQRWSSGAGPGGYAGKWGSNIIVDAIPRGPRFWEPPPGRNPELGIGRRIARQTPLRREAVRKALWK
ncbi:hypothetical protein Pars_0875 [Pyrobaculum arsenaticum DSM 13514]|uniref:Uncharacterized protein n=1 Tax=Pyrobaculum arsenaticum (strain DSM 13514 / JCM 11321 / PZ6) TaxID=340102 RepID=A4WJ93_PYRAR|nr:hypothetical protein Pars_0875 [Pyrobaculum arsenaticum DSM 13514]